MKFEGGDNILLPPNIDESSSIPPLGLEGVEEETGYRQQRNSRHQHRRHSGTITKALNTLVNGDDLEIPVEELPQVIVEDDRKPNTRRNLQFMPAVLTTGTEATLPMNQVESTIFPYDQKRTIKVPSQPQQQAPKIPTEIVRLTTTQQINETPRFVENNALNWVLNTFNGMRPSVQKKNTLNAIETIDTSNLSADDLIKLEQLKQKINSGLFNSLFLRQGIETVIAAPPIITSVSAGLAVELGRINPVFYSLLALSAMEFVPIPLPFAGLSGIVRGIYFTATKGIPASIREPKRAWKNLGLSLATALDGGYLFVPSLIASTSRKAKDVREMYDLKSKGVVDTFERLKTLLLVGKEFGIEVVDKKNLHEYYEAFAEVLDASWDRRPWNEGKVCIEHETPPFDTRPRHTWLSSEAPLQCPDCGKPPIKAWSLERTKQYLDELTQNDDFQGFIITQKDKDGNKHLWAWFLAYRTSLQKLFPDKSILVDGAETNSEIPVGYIETVGRNPKISGKTKRQKLLVNLTAKHYQKTRLKPHIKRWMMRTHIEENGLVNHAKSMHDFDMLPNCNSKFNPKRFYFMSKLGGKNGVKIDIV